MENYYIENEHGQKVSVPMSVVFLKEIHKYKIGHKTELYIQKFRDENKYMAFATKTNETFLVSGSEEKIKTHFKFI